MRMEDTEWHVLKRMVALAELDARRFYTGDVRKAGRPLCRRLRAIRKQARKAWKEAVKIYYTKKRKHWRGFGPIPPAPDAEESSSAEKPST